MKRSCFVVIDERDDYTAFALDSVAVINTTFSAYVKRKTAASLIGQL